MKTLLALLLLIPSLSWGEDFKMSCYSFETHTEDGKTFLGSHESANFFNLIKNADEISIDFGKGDPKNKNAYIILNEDKDILKFKDIYSSAYYKYFKVPQILIISRFDDLSQQIHRSKVSCYGEKNNFGIPSNTLN